MAQNKLQEGDGTFALGMNSLLDPLQLSPGAYSRGMNVVNRGGIVQCRPGYECMMVLPEGRQQGGTMFVPKIGLPTFVFGTEGALYWSEYPYKTFNQFPDVEFSSEASQLYFKQVEQSVKVNPDNSLALLDTPRNLLIIQDGGTARAVIFDGSSAKHTTDIPPGGPMEWVGDRLWVARGTALLASDIANPTSFVEPIYIASPSQFTLPSPVVALTKTPGDLGVTNPQLLALTESGVSLFQAGIRNRAVWSSTPNFQKDDVFKFDCVSARSVVTKNGFLYWYSSFGLVSLDSAAQSNISSEISYQDAEMNESRSRLSSDLSGICACAHENYLLVSVPHEDLFNTHTWVHDGTPLITAPANVSSWNSFWTGTRPVEWIPAKVQGVDRVFYISNDYDDQARLWEAFTPDRRDDGCPITCWVETRAMAHGHPGKLKEFRFADVFVSELSGTVDFAVFWAGSHRGKYKRILSKRIIASRGSIRSGEIITATTKLFALKKQSRPLRTQDGRALIAEETLSSCDVEAPNTDVKDEAFQLLIVWSGPAAIRGFLTYVEPPVNDDDSGRCENNETEENFVRFDGGASEADNFEEALVEFVENNPTFTSTQTETVSQGDLTEVGVGSATSIISQDNADYVASCIARRKACAALEMALPQIISIGEVANSL